MKKKQSALLAALSGLALILTGCLAISVYPFYSSKDVVFEPGLLGHWAKVNDAKEQWTFDKKGQNAYQLSYTDGDKTNVVVVHAFRIQEQLFLDLFNPEGSGELVPPPVPTHLLLRVFQLKPTLRMTALSYDWLSKLLENEPQAIRHHVVVSEGDKEGQIVLTADTPELQRFIIKNLDTKEAWADPFDLEKSK